VYTAYCITGVGVYTNDRERPVPGRGIARSREEVRRIERPETGINNEYKQRLIQTKATTLKTTRHLNRGCSFVYFKLLCTRTARPAHPRNLLTIHKAHRLGLYSACHRPRVRVHARRFSFCTAADARATLALAHSRPRLPQRLAGGCRFGEVMRCCVAAVPHRG
jgi:hypothetical protein